MTLTRLIRHGLRAASLACVAALTPALAQDSAPQPAAASEFRGLHIEVVGQGRPLLMIPGLNSAGSVWRDTCAALQPQVQCHIVQLPGFAGQPAVPTETFLSEMRDRLWAYADSRRLQQPVLMGHSLGGTLALMMAAQRPEAPARLVIVDALPFVGGLRGPGVTPEMARQNAEAMRQQMSALSDEQWAAAAPQAARGMSRDPQRSVELIAWGRASTRATTIQAMAEMWGGDFRPLLPQIQRPVLVLGAWAAYEPMGSTLESTRRIFEGQYAGLPAKRIEMSARGYHFLMWDDPQWLVAQVRDFLAQR